MTSKEDRSQYFILEHGYKWEGRKNKQAIVCHHRSGVPSQEHSFSSLDPSNSCLEKKRITKSHNKIKYNEIWNEEIKKSVKRSAQLADWTLADGDALSLCARSTGVDRLCWWRCQTKTTVLVYPVVSRNTHAIIELEIERTRVCDVGWLYFVVPNLSSRATLDFDSEKADRSLFSRLLLSS